jgi:hypothetical protein
LGTTLIRLFCDTLKRRNPTEDDLPGNASSTRRSRKTLMGKPPLTSYQILTEIVTTHTTMRRTIRTMTHTGRGERSIIDEPTSTTTTNCCRKLIIEQGRRRDMQE